MKSTPSVHLVPLKSSQLLFKNAQIMLEFTEDSHILFSLSTRGEIHIIELPSLKIETSPILIPDTTQRIQPRMATISTSFAWIIIVSIDCSIWVYELSTKKLYWRVPYSGYPTCIKCLEGDKLIVVGDKNEIMFYDVTHKSLDKWSKQYGNSLPSNYLDRFNRVYDIIQINPHKYLLYTHYTFIILDTTKPLPRQSRCITNKSYAFNKNEEDVKEIWAKLTTAHQRMIINSSLKGKENMKKSLNESRAEDEEQDKDKEKGEENTNMSIYNKYSVIIKMKFNDNENRLYVVESPWSKMLKAFPETLFTHKYGH